MVGHKDFSSHCGSYSENIHAHTKTDIHMKNVLYLEIKTNWNRKYCVSVSKEYQNHLFFWGEMLC